MSRLYRLGLLVAVGILLGPSTVSAQQTEEELRQRLDELRPQVQQARLELEEHRQSVQRDRRERAEAEANQDTLQVGLMTIVTPVDQVETARRLFSEVWEERYSNIHASPGLERTTFAFQWATSYVPLYASEGEREIKLPRWIPEQRVKEQIGAAIGTSIAFDLSALDTEVGEWVSALVFQHQRTQDTYRQLATTGAISTRRCLEGDIGSCEVALGLGIENQATAYREWYTPDERRALVGRRQELGVRRSTSETWDECVNHAVDSACDDLLSDSRHRWAPLSGPTRATLLQLALDIGGAGAWGRLLENPTLPPERALEAASGLPLDALVAEWRTTIIDGRPEIYTGLLPKGGMALVWTLVFAAFAMRSTRWRLG